jgi:pre-mRNA-processing factor 40
MSSRGSGRREDWKEYVDSEGKTYYYNVITKEVTWIKPRVLIGKGESQKGEWKEFTTAEGKVYYHNALTGETTWTRPPEMRASGPDRMAQDDAISSLLGADSALGGPDDYFDSATRKERTQAFHSLLEEYDIDPELPWVEALKKIINDP